LIGEITSFQKAASLLFRVRACGISHQTKQKFRRWQKRDWNYEIYEKAGQI